MDETQIQPQGMQSLTHQDSTQPQDPVKPVSTSQQIAPPPAGHSLTEIPIDKIKPNPWQPRKIFADFDRDNLPEIMPVLFSAGAILSSPAAFEDSLIFATAEGWVYRVR